MYRPICRIGHRVSYERHSKEFVRNKVVHPASILKPAEKIKLYNKENKDLFGPLLKKKQNSKKAGKSKPCMISAILSLVFIESKVTCLLLSKTQVKSMIYRSDTFCQLTIQSLAAIAVSDQSRSLF